ASLLDRALAFEKTDRWPSAEAMLRALRDARRAIAVASDPAREDSAVITISRPRAARGRSLVFGSIAIALLGAGVGAFALVHRSAAARTTGRGTSAEVDPPGASSPSSSTELVEIARNEVESEAVGSSSS